MSARLGEKEVHSSLRTESMSDVQQETIAPEEQALHHEGTEERREEVPPEVLAHRGKLKSLPSFAKICCRSGKGHGSLRCCLA